MDAVTWNEEETAPCCCLPTAPPPPPPPVLLKSRPGVGPRAKETRSVGEGKNEEEEQASRGRRVLLGRANSGQRGTHHLPPGKGRGFTSKSQPGVVVGPMPCVLFCPGGAKQGGSEQKDMALQQYTHGLEPEPTQYCTGLRGGKRRKGGRAGQKRITCGGGTQNSNAGRPGR